MARRNDALFAECASPEAIRAHLAKARAAARKAQRHVDWLEDLLERRTAERDAGTWPHSTTGEVPR